MSLPHLFHCVNNPTAKLADFFGKMPSPILVGGTKAPLGNYPSVYPVHIAGNAGALPFTGITLPFVSYGGSSLVTSLAGVGVLLSISRSADKWKVGASAAFAFGRRDRRPHLSRARRR